MFTRSLRHIFPPARPVVGRRAFTLVELLTVIAIIGVLAAIILPVVSRVRKSARSAVCVTNLKGVGVAFQLYAADNRNKLPALRYNESKYSNDRNPSGGGWMVEIAPYLSHTPKAEDKVFKKVFSTAHAYAFCPEYLSLYRDRIPNSSIQAGGYGMNSNVITSGNPWDERFPVSQVVAPSQMILVGDSTDYHLNIKAADGWPANSTPDTRPGNYESGDPERHGAHANYLYVDGHVKSLKPDAAFQALTEPPR